MSLKEGWYPFKNYATEPGIATATFIHWDSILLNGKPDGQ